MNIEAQKHAPVYEALERFRKQRIVPFDVPGHKRGRGNPELKELLGEKCVSLDVNSMKPLDNLCHPMSVIKEAEELAAEAFGDIASPKVHKGPANLLEQLNDAFSIDDLLKVRNKGTSPDQVEKATNLVSQWKKRGFIEYVVNADGTKDYKKTETYLASRQSAA